MPAARGALAGGRERLRQDCPIDDCVEEVDAGGEVEDVQRVAGRTSEDAAEGGTNGHPNEEHAKVEREDAGASKEISMVDYVVMHV